MAMSTKDVPGANPQNADVLAMGSWAEHDDGSLILVESTEGGRVVYSMFDFAQGEIVEYRDAMEQKAFEDQFSWPGSVGDVRWTWHDKTPFPWDRILDDARPGLRHPSASQQLSAAQRVAQSLNLRARALSADRKSMLRSMRRGVGHIMQGIRDAVKELRP